MPHPKLLRLAEEEVTRALQQLPEDVAEAAGECVVIYGDAADPEQMGAAGDDAEVIDEGEDEEGGEALLGLFEGYSRLDPLPGIPEEMPRITLFLETLWKMTEEDEKEYRKEVRLTYLHELGHYLGWDEEQVAAMGLA